MNKVTKQKYNFGEKGLQITIGKGTFTHTVHWNSEILEINPTPKLHEIYKQIDCNLNNNNTHSIFIVSICIENSTFPAKPWGMTLGLGLKLWQRP